MRPPITIMGIPMHPWTIDESVIEIGKRIDLGIFTQHVVINVAKLVHMQTDYSLRSAVLDCDIINIDGMGIVWGARLLGFNVPERVAGIDLFYHLLTLAEKVGYPVYFLGAKPDVIERAIIKTKECYPNLVIAGYHHGYFWDNEEDIVRMIQYSRAKMLFVATSSPQKEQFISRWKNSLGVDFAMGVGGTFDIIAGKTKRAPLWMQKCGMEWLYRLIQEPGRMWRRYLTTNLKYIFMLIKELRAKYLY